MSTTDDDAANAEPEEHPQGTANLPDVIAETVTAVATGIPPQIQRNLFKAVGRVFLAGAEWPAKALEGKGRAASARANVEVARLEAEASDVKARQKAREVIYRDSAKAAAALFKDPEQAFRALDFHAADIVREQSIREDVTLIAADELKKDPPISDTSVEIEDDWLNSFYREASKRSTEEYKHLFGRILSGEIRSPGSFSIGTIEILARLNAHTADLFQKACNISFSSLAGNIKIMSEPFASAGENGLAPYGLSYNDIARLVEEGFIRSELTEQVSVPDTMLRSGIYIEHSGQKMLMIRPNIEENTPFTASIDFSGPSFTIAGSELRRVVTMHPSEIYIQAFAKWLKDNRIDLYHNISIAGTEVRGDKVEIIP